MTIKWNCSKADMVLITKIVDRAAEALLNER